MASIIGQYTLDELLPAIATGLGAMGMFPSAPKYVKDAVAQFPALKWVAVFILVWQGGGGGDTSLAMYTAIIMYIAYYVLDYMYDMYN